MRSGLPSRRLDVLRNLLRKRVSACRLSEQLPRLCGDGMIRGTDSTKGGGMGPESEDPGATTGADGEPPSNVLILPSSVERELDPSDESLGALGRPFDHRAPFFVGLTAAFGVAVAYVIARGIADVATVLVIIGLALFIAIGLDP